MSIVNLRFQERKVKNLQDLKISSDSADYVDSPSNGNLWNW